MAKPRKKDKTELSVVDSKAAPGALESGATPENWADQRESEPYQTAQDLYSRIQKQYDNQADRDDNIVEYWNIYNAEPDENQQYAGNSQGYVPAVRDAIRARVKRRLAQLFPTTQKHVNAINADGETPYPQLALLEHYIRTTKLKDIVRSDLTAGDVTGQWNLYVDWTKSYRRVTELVKRNPIMEEVQGATPLGRERIEFSDPAQDEEEDIEERDVIEEGIEVVDFATEDLAVIPPTCNDINKAEAVSLRLRMSATKVEELVDAGVFVLPEGSDVDKWVKDAVNPDGSREKTVPPKQRTNDAGIKTQGTYKYALIYEVSTMLDFGDGVKRLGLIYYAGPQDIIGIIKAPWWGGKRNILSAPADRISGSFNGRSAVEPIKYMQWNVTDLWNMGQDSAFYALLPIVMTDPLKNPNYQQMVYGLAAVWPTSPNDTKFANFPDLWRQAFEICDRMERRIWKALDVTEMQMGEMPKGRRNAQQMGGAAAEAGIAISDDASRYEDVMLNPLLELMFEFDCQYRDTTLTIKSRGQLGAKAKMIPIDPQQFGERFFFQWQGTAYIMGMQRLQQQIAWMNVLKGTPPQLLNGRKFDATPILEAGTDNIFGPEVTPRILIDERNLYTLGPETENEILLNGMPADVHMGDDDAQHIQSHQKAAAMAPDMARFFKPHIMAHMAQLQGKRQKQMAQQQGLPGAPGGAGPGVGGTPRPGAVPALPRGGQQPPGAVHQDQIGDMR